MPADPSAYPFDTVVRIEDVINGATYQASGVLIAPDEVLTCSHVVWQQDQGTASAITVTPGYNDGSAPFGSAQGVAYHYNPIADAYDVIPFADAQNDFAVIHLDHPFANLGTMQPTPGFAGGAATLTGYPASAGGAQFSAQEGFYSESPFSLLGGMSAGPGSSGGPVWIAGPAGAEVVALAWGGGGQGFGSFVALTPGKIQQIETWVAEDEGTAAPISVRDVTQGVPLAASGTAYSGPVAGLQEQFLDLTSDNINVTLGSPNWFIHTGSGNDAIAAASGSNVLDGGTGSNFLSGGSGTDTFFVDDRGPAADTWSTVTGFRAGDSATVWGVTPAGFTLSWADGQGAQGYAGLTLHAAAPGRPTASITLSGWTQQDLDSGRLTAVFGTDAASGSPYMYLHANW